MEDNSLAFTPVVELARLLRAKKLSPVELVDLLLKRIEDLNPKLNAYLTVTGEEAREAARKAEKAFQKGEELHPMFGILISIKDLFLTRGIRTTCGSITSENTVPKEDIIAVERLRKTGAIILGKTNTPEFGMSPTTENRLGDNYHNPWNIDCVSGGSNGGSAAAIAAGLGPLTIGSDGKVERVYVEEGDRVNKGDALAKLDTDALELAVTQAELLRLDLSSELVQNKNN